ncbi:MAG: tetratricopeptide repeat protein [Pseudomonadota bacterium]
MAKSPSAAQSRQPAIDRNLVDVTWERVQEQAMHAYQTGSAATARTSWIKALDIAERHFERGDPRLAASLSNYGFALMRQRNYQQARLYFQRAITAWEDSWCWVPWMTSSSEEGEAIRYDRATQDAFYALIEQGKAITETLWLENRLPEAIGDGWEAVKPKAMNDIRRLFGAVFLLPTARTAPTGRKKDHRAA